jgi:hypothetical protein
MCSLFCAWHSLTYNFLSPHPQLSTGIEAVFSSTPFVIQNTRQIGLG